MREIKLHSPKKSDRILDITIICATVFLLTFAFYQQLSFFFLENISDELKPVVDYIPFWAAGKLAYTGQSAVVYNLEIIKQTERVVIPTLQNYLPWLNPPTFLVVMNVLGAFEFATSFGIWTVLTTFFYLITAWCLFPNRYTFLCAAFFPPFIFSFLIGQTGALTASLTIIALLNCEKRPFMAGILIGLLAIKPQTAVLIPVAFVASRNWKAFISATCSTFIFIVMTIVLYGTEIWHSFYINTLRHNNIILSKTYNDYYLQSLYGFFQYLELNTDIALIIQGIFAVISVAIVYICWSCKWLALNNKITVLVVCTLMLQSYTVIYDFTVLYFAIILLIKFPFYHTSFYKRTGIIALGSSFFLFLMYLKEPGGFFLCVFLLAVVAADMRAEYKIRNVSAT